MPHSSQIALVLFREGAAGEYLSAERKIIILSVFVALTFTSTPSGE
jgi:hypothetical protein